MTEPGPLPTPPAHVRRANLARWGIVAVLAVLAVVTLVTLDLPPLARVARGLRNNALPLLRGFVQPEWEIFPLAFRSMAETFFMAVIGTTIGGALAFPLAFLAAGNLLGGTRFAAPGKTVLVAIRTFPEILLAIIFVAATGPGPTAGIMAMGIHSVGFLGKIFADVIEEIGRASCRERV
jgi:phosphonate transport system permease protein